VSSKTANGPTMRLYFFLPDTGNDGIKNNHKFYDVFQIRKPT
jgi:hypothetical protein